MDGTSLVAKLKNNPNADPQGNVFQEIWSEYERVIVHSLITSFGLDFIVHDQHGGDVDTIHNVKLIGTDKNLDYKNSYNKQQYSQLDEYNDQLKYEYHGGSERYRETNRYYSELKKSGKLVDAYTNKRIALNARIDLDHAISTKEIHEDPGRVLAGLSVDELANTRSNLNPTDMRINRSMKDTPKKEYLEIHKERKDERQAIIERLSAKSDLNDKERETLEKQKKLDEIDPEAVNEREKEARDQYNKTIAVSYYTSPRFLSDAASAAMKRGTEMALRQALGLVFVEIWISVEDELSLIKERSGLEEMFNSVATGVKTGFENAKNKFGELITNLGEGFVSGSLASLTTTLSNIFVTTSKNTVRFIRQVHAAVVQAGRVLLFNPDDLMLGNRIKTATVILATAASVVIGTAVSELISKTPVGMIPTLGGIVTSFCGSLVSGLISCTLLVYLDRSKFINDIIDRLNTIPTEVNNYKVFADAMVILGARLSQIDIEQFKKETMRFSLIATEIEECNDEDQLNNLLKDSYNELGIKIPWEGNFDSFMADRSNKLVFG